MRYGSRGWNVKCPRCGTVKSGETRSGAPLPEGASKQLAI